MASNPAMDGPPSWHQRARLRARRLIPVRLAGPLTVDEEFQSMVDEDTIGPLLKPSIRPDPQFKAELERRMLEEFDRRNG